MMRAFVFGAAAAVASPASEVGSILTSMQGSGSAPPAAASGSSDPAVNRIQKNIIAAAEIFDDAESVNSSGEEKALKAAVRSALASTPSVRGNFPGFGTSTGASFLKKVNGKISMGELAAAGDAALRAANSQVPYTPVNSKCSSCRPNYSSCPSGFDAAGAGTCVPSASYTGYCNKALSLTQYSQIELEELTALCDVCFPCESSFLKKDSTSPIKVSGNSHVYAANADVQHAVALADAWMRGQIHALAHKSSFMKKAAWATKEQANTASLFLTQPLRSDSLTKINVIEKAPQGVNADADFARATAEREEFVAGLAALR